MEILNKEANSPCKFLKVTFLLKKVREGGKSIQDGSVLFVSANVHYIDQKLAEFWQD